MSQETLKVQEEFRKSAEALTSYIKGERLVGKQELDDILKDLIRCQRWYAGKEAKFIGRAKNYVRLENSEDAWAYLDALIDGLKGKDPSWGEMKQENKDLRQQVRNLKEQVARLISSIGKKQPPTPSNQVNICLVGKDFPGEKFFIFTTPMKTRVTHRDPWDELIVEPVQKQITIRVNDEGYATQIDVRELAQ